jgi:hypothetical protein
MANENLNADMLARVMLESSEKICDSIDRLTHSVYLLRVDMDACMGNLKHQIEDDLSHHGALNRMVKALETISSTMANEVLKADDIGGK